MLEVQCQLQSKSRLEYSAFMKWLSKATLIVKWPPTIFADNKNFLSVKALQLMLINQHNFEVIFYLRLKYQSTLGHAYVVIKSDFIFVNYLFNFFIKNQFWSKYKCISNYYVCRKSRLKPAGNIKLGRFQRQFY